MVRVLHIADPEDAGRRLRDLEVSPGEASILLRDLRKFLLFHPDNGPPLASLSGILSGNGIPFARARRGICFSVSSDAQMAMWSRQSGLAEAALAPARDAIRRYTTREFSLSCRDRSLPLSGR